MLSVTQACCYVPIGYDFIVARAIMMIWTCAERFADVPIDYGLLAHYHVIHNLLSIILLKDMLKCHRYIGFGDNEHFFAAVSHGFRIS